MGLFDFLVKAGNSIVNAIKPVVDPIVYAVAHPVTAAVSLANGTFQQHVQQFYAQPVRKQVTALATTAIEGTGAILTGGALSAATDIGAAAALKAAGTIQKVTQAAAITAEVVGNAPTITSKAVQTANNALANIPSTISDTDALAKNPTPENIYNYIQNHKGVDVVALLAAGVIAKEAYQAYLLWSNNRLIATNNQLTAQSNQEAATPPASTPAIPSTPAPITIINQIPAAAAIAKKPAVKKRKKKSIKRRKHKK